MLEQKNNGIVFNIQNFTVHDGPGIRTEVFLKGCNFRCKWCSNPESFNVNQEVGLYEARCIGISKCGYCINSCTKDALIVKNDKIVGINKDNCTQCLKCAEVCPSNALQFWGKKMNVQEVMDNILPDKNIYKKSGGGVTFSGGEALVQWEFVLEILKQCKKENIHTCVESALHCNPKIIDEILPYTDLFISDIKHMDNDKHIKYTGLDNKLTLKNIKKIIDSNKPIIVRIPVVPEHNDNKENIDKTIHFILNDLNNKISQVQLLRYRRLGEEKYKSLSLEYPMADLEYPNVDDFEEKLENYAQLMKSFGIPAVVGSTSKMDFK